MNMAHAYFWSPQVVVATAISGPLNLPKIYHMDIVGEIPLG